MFRVRHIAFSLAIVGVAASLPTDLAHARGQALKRHIHSASLGRKPARWCGWWMRTQKGGGPEMNLARNWARWGSPSGPRVGAVVVLASPCRPDYRANCERRVDRALGQ